MHIRPDRNLEDKDEDDEEEEDDVHDLMACHSSTQANSYAINANMLRSLTFHSISKFRAIANRWHCFLHLNSQQKADDRKQKRELSPDAIVRRNTKRCKLGRTDFECSLQEAMDIFIGPNSTFRSPEQRE